MGRIVETIETYDDYDNLVSKQQSVTATAEEKVARNECSWECDCDERCGECCDTEFGWEPENKDLLDVEKLVKSVGIIAAAIGGGLLLNRLIRRARR